MENEVPQIPKPDLSQIAKCVGAIADISEINDPEIQKNAEIYGKSIIDGGDDVIKVAQRLGEFTWLQKLDLRGMEISENDEISFYHEPTYVRHPDPVSWFTRSPSQMRDMLHDDTKMNEIRDLIVPLAGHGQTGLGMLPLIMVCYDDPTLILEFHGERNSHIQFEDILDRFETVSKIPKEQQAILLSEMQTVDLDIITLYDDRLTQEGLEKYIDFNKGQRDKVWDLKKKIDDGFDFNFLCDLATNTELYDVYILHDEYLKRIHSGQYEQFRIANGTALFKSIISKVGEQPNFNIKDYVTESGVPTEKYFNEALKSCSPNEENYEWFEAIDSPEAIDGMTGPGKTYWKFWHEYAMEGTSLRNFLSGQQSNFDNLVDESGLPTSTMLDAMLTEHGDSYQGIELLITDAVLEKMDNKDKHFWTFWQQFPENDDIKVFFIDHKEQLGEFLDDKGCPTLALVEAAVPDPNVSREIVASWITDDLLASMPEHDQKFWSFWRGTESGLVRHFIGVNRERMGKYVVNGQVTEKLLNEVIMDADAKYDGPAIKALVTDAVLETLSDKSKNFWKKFRQHESREILKHMIIHKNDIDTYIDRDGYPTEKMLECMITDENHEYKEASMWARRYLAYMTPEGKKFWTLWLDNNVEQDRNIATTICAHLADFQSTVVASEESSVQSKIFEFLLSQSDSASAASWVRRWSKDEWKTYMGEKTFSEFLHALPAQNDEVKNAFTHNKFDRTSIFIDFIIRKCGDDVKQLKPENYASVVGKYIQSFGLAKSASLFHYYSNLKLLELKQIQYLSDDVAALEINTSNELLNKYINLSQKVYADEALQPETLNTITIFEKQLLTTITGKDKHRFDKDRPTFAQIVERFSTDYNANLIPPLAEGYVSESLTLQNKMITFDEAKIKTEYIKLREEIVGGIDRPTDPSDVITELHSYYDRRVNEIRMSLEKIPPGQRQFVQNSLNKTIELQTNLKSIKTVDGLLTSLINNPFGKGDKQVYQQMIRKCLFKKLFEKHASPQFVENLRNTLSGEEIDPQSLTSVVNVVDEMVKAHLLNLSNNNDEAYWTKDVFALLSEKKTRDNFEGLFTDATKIRQEVNNFKIAITEGSTQIRFIPDKGLIGEMSGYLADVCYTKEFPLLSKWPVTPYKFVTVENGERKFIGSVLVFEQKDINDDTCLLIRAFDVPDETKYPIGDMIETFADNLVKVAKVRGAKKIIAAGTAGTISNYQMTTNHFLSRYKKEENRVPLKEKFAFNGYNITNECYLVRTVGDN